MEVLNKAAFDRNFGNRETQERLSLRPGINSVEEGLFDRMSMADERLNALLESGDVVVCDGAALSKLVSDVENGNLSIRDVMPVRDAIRVVREIDSVGTLKELYRECNRVSVRSAVVKALRAKGFTGDIN